MNSQRRLVTVLLVAFIFLAIGGGLGYMLFLSPISQKNEATAKLSREAGELEQKLADQRRTLTRLGDVKKRSLPADEAIADRAYRDLLDDLLRRAKAPAGSTVKPRAVDQKSNPLLTATPKKPVYIRMAYDITMPKADLWSLVNFLQSYYKLNLLQQITSIEIRKAEDVTAGGGKFTATDGSDRKDLNVKIITEALILDGSESRRSAVPVSNAFAAIGGIAGHHAVSWTPGIGHQLAPLQFTPVLAAQPREYFAMIAHDPFHGTLPKPPPPEPKRPAPLPPPPVEEDPPPVVKIKPDISPYIHLVGITLRPSDATAGIQVRDRMNNTEYEIEFSTSQVEVRKYVGTAGRRQLDPDSKPAGLLSISDLESSTTRLFKVIGVEFNNLYLVDMKDTPQGMSGFAAAAGGPAVLLPPPRKVLRWHLGDSLKQITVATPEEIRRLFSGPEPVAMAPR